MTIKPLTGLLLILALMVIPVFGHMDQLPIIQWDESRLAMNALEMYYNGDWMVTYFNGAPDMWNTKPPLMIWLQVASMHLFGVNELAIRFPTMIAACCTCLLLYWFLAIKMKKPLLAVLSVLVLITSEGFVRIHVSRTGDYDALLVLFMLASCVFMYLFIEEERARVRNLYLFYAALTLAFMTKGIPSLIFLPAILLYIAWRRRLPLLFKNIHAYIGAAVFLLIVGGYYLLREHYNPGYLQAVLYNDFTGRYLHTDMNNGDDVEFYLHLLTERLFSYWYLLIFPAILLGAMHKDERLRHLSVYASLLAVFHFLVISKAQTKNEWYDAATYPFWSLIVALFLYTICALLTTHVTTGAILKKNVLPLAFLWLVFLLPYSKIINNSLGPIAHAHLSDNEKMGAYLKEILHDKGRRPDAAIVGEGLYGDIRWYQRALEKQQRPVADADFKTLIPGNKVMAYQSSVKRYIEAHYDTRILETVASVTVYLINGVRQ